MTLKILQIAGKHACHNLTALRNYAAPSGLRFTCNVAITGLHPVLVYLPLSGPSRAVYQTKPETMVALTGPDTPAMGETHRTGTPQQHKAPPGQHTLAIDEAHRTEHAKRTPALTGPHTLAMGETHRTKHVQPHKAPPGRHT